MIQSLHQKWSLFEPGSLIDRINHLPPGKPFKADREASLFFETAHKVHLLSDGAFDITVLPLRRFWKSCELKNSLPLQSEWEKVLSCCGYERVLELKGGRFRWIIPGAAIDGGGMIKGFAAEVCLELLNKIGIKQSLLNLGGSVTLQGSSPSGEPWRVGIRLPSSNPAIAASLEVKDTSVVTSGSYERFFSIGGQRFSHIIDPREGRPIHSDLQSATVIHQNAALADGLATACMVLGTEKSISLIKNCPKGGAALLDMQGRLHCINIPGDTLHSVVPVIRH